MGSDNRKGVRRFSERIGEEEERKLKAQSENQRSVWFGLGMFGMVGWSVAVPTLLGAMLGIWLDRRYPQSFSWTLALLIIGLFSGALVAAHWVLKENREMNNSKTKKDE